MKLLSTALVLCLALAFTNAHHIAMHHDDTVTAEKPDRCDGIEFDAIAPDEKGVTYFFKGDYLWKGFSGPAQLTSESFKELHDLGHHVDAALRMHSTDNVHDHDHMYLFLDDKVFSYYNHTLEDGYPKEIHQDFPGVPGHLDAAAECPKGECVTDSVLFFKGHDVYNYDIATKTAKQKTWSHLPNCTSVFRWMEHYYCFHGTNFTRFHPVSGEVDAEGSYPKDARNYFMKCPNFGHGGNHQVPKCSEISLDAITTDDTGKTYSFKGPIYMRLDTHRDGMHAFPITRAWKEVVGAVDAVFSHTNKLYIIQGDHVYIYKSGAHYTLIEGYPKTLKEELGIEGHVDAAFACDNEQTVHIIHGSKMCDIDLSATPRVLKHEFNLPLSNISAGLCGPDGVKLFSGSVYYKYESPRILAVSRIAPEPLNITSAMIGCQD